MILSVCLICYMKSHHCMVVVVFLLFCGLHNEAGDSKFRNRRQYIAYVGHVGENTVSAFGYVIQYKS